MGLAEAVQTVLGKYADFSGRARRSEYWYWTLAVLIFDIVLIILMSTGAKVLVFLAILLYLAILLPSLAVGVRRLHDGGRSSWWLLLGIVPFGGLVLLVWFVMEGTAGPNQYGPDPTGAAGYDAPPAGQPA